MPVQKCSLKIGKGQLFGIGNPLLDITATSVTNEFLEKHGLQPNTSTIVEDNDGKVDRILNDVINNFGVKYTPCGAVENVLRTFQWSLGKGNEGASIVMGCIGKDAFANRLTTAVAEEGITPYYMIDETRPTGICIVLISGNGSHRTLVASLGAAQNFDKRHLEKNFDVVKEARIYYCSSYFLGLSSESVLCIAKHAFESQNKLFCFNFGAPFTMKNPKYFKPMIEVISLSDYVFGNETEARTFAEANNWQTTTLSEIVLKIANEVELQRKERWIIITQESKPILVAKNGSSEVQSFPIKEMKSEEIVDTNGAGDAFVGGFLAQLIQRKCLATCMRCGIFAASECIQRIGVTLPTKCQFVE